MTTNRSTVYPIIALLLLMLLLSLLVIGSASANDQSSYIGLIRKMESEETGLVNPAGIVFSSRANVFHVFDTTGSQNNLLNTTVVNDVSVFGHNVDSALIMVGIENPINIAMDNKSGRLLTYQGSTQQLFELYEDSEGNLDPNTLTTYDANSFGLQDPQGMTFDPIQGSLYFLDAVGPRLVRVMFQPDGSYTAGSVDAVDLPWAGNMGLHGLAYDPGSGNFHAVNPVEQRLYEFTASGEMVTFRDLSEFNLSNPQSIVFAASTDQTDDPLEMSLFLVDSGKIQNSSVDLSSSDNSSISGNRGKILELSLVQPLEQIDANFTSALIKTTDTSAFSPPSPDPSGLTYLGSSNTLLISDADVEETKLGITHFMGANLWEVTLGGSVVRTANISPVPYNTPSFVPMTYEPTGVAWNPGNGHYYFSDDNAQAVFDLNPGIDGLYGTVDDSWTSFLTVPEDGDPEGIAYDSWHDRLFVIDGTNLEVYEYTLTGTLVHQFDVATFGAIDTESIEFNSISGTLFILSNLTSRKIYETDTNGIALINTIDTTAASAMDPAGITYAPASNGSGVMRFYIVDRMVDNGADPNENDGKLYEITAPVASAPTNIPPIVNAGADQYVTFGNSATLVGSATDDGLPSPLTYLWTAESGPGIVSIAAPTALSTTASFSSAGTYVLRLTAFDGEYHSYNEINIYVTNVDDSTIFEIRVVTSSDDAEENPIGGVMDLVSPDLDNGMRTVGLRFNGVNLPKNAIINNAYVQFQTSEADTLSTPLTIWGEAQDNPGTFLASTQNISSRLKTSYSVSWSPPSWTLVDEVGVGQRTSNIATILQEILNRPGWSSGNSMVIIIAGTGKRSAWAVDGRPSGAPRLHVEYTTSSNHPPVAVNDAYTTNEDTQLSRNANQGVLKNDTDADIGDTLTAVINTTPSHGTVTLNPNGSFVYMPAANYNGTDSFTYYANDGVFNSNIATVTITVTPVNDAPVANSQSVSTAEDTLKAITLTASDIDGDTLSWIIVAQPSHGTLSGSGAAQNYTPSLNYNGADSFTFKVNDGHVDSNVATVSITVTPVNDAPVANNQSVSTAEETPKSITLTATDAEGDPLTWIIVSQPSHGTLSGTAPNLNYTPVLNYNGVDSFTFKVNDSHVDSNVATVTITVTPVNDTPASVNDSYSMYNETILIVDEPGVLSNDTDPDGDPLTAFLVDGPSHGHLTLNSDGSLVYTPNMYYFGTDHFTYYASDGLLDSNISTVSISVNWGSTKYYLPILLRK